MNKYRSFELIYKNNNNEIVCCGNYLGAKPKQAAAKAFSGLIKLLKKTNSYNIGEIKYFGIKETTTGSNNKKFWFSGQCIELNDPVTIETSSGEKITYTYSTTIKKASDECKELQSYFENFSISSTE